MHNGGVENFSAIKRKIREPLDDQLYEWIKGQTDSEHIFAYLINYLINNHKVITTATVIDAFEYTFSSLKKLMAAHGIHEAAYLNMVITNGSFIVGTRYVTSPKEDPLTLYHSEGSRYVVEGGISQMVAPEDNDHAVLVVSEKLTDDKDWTLIPANHFVVVDSSLNVKIRPIEA